MTFQWHHEAPRLWQVWGDTGFIELMAMSPSHALATAEELFPGKPIRAMLAPEWNDNQLPF